MFSCFFHGHLVHNLPQQKRLDMHYSCAALLMWLMWYFKGEMQYYIRPLQE